MAAKPVAASSPEEKPDPQTTAFEAQKARFDEAVAKTKANGDAVPAGAEAAPAAEAPPKPVKKAKKPRLEPSPFEQEVAELKRQVAELSKAKAEPEIDERVELARSRLTERFGTEEADVILESFSALREDDRRQIAEMRSVIEEATKAGRANLSRSNQRRLSKQHPQLKSPDAWGVIHDRAMSVYEKNPKGFDSIEDAYDEVVTALYGEPEEEPEDAAEAPEEVEELASRIAASQMTAPTKSPRRENRSKEERAKEHFEFMKNNPDDKAGAKRLARELGLR